MGSLLSLVTSDEQLDQILGQSTTTPTLIFKHSTSCPISAHAYHEMEQFLKQPESQGIFTYMIHVIEDRTISLALAERVGVRHQSPQALLVLDGKVIWHASHYQITVDELKKVVSELEG